MSSPLLSFTPSAQDPDILERLFVARTELLDSLVDDVDAMVSRPADRHHRLLVGPRGIGKSHLIALLAHRCKERFAGSAIQLAWLPEDIWGLASFRDLVDRILDELLPADGRSDEEAFERRASGDDDAERLLRDAIGNRPTLLLLENLDVIVEALSREGVRRLRSVAEDCPMLVVATSPLLFDEVRRTSEPFYGFFDAVQLAELTTTEAKELLTKVAELRNDQRLVRFLGTPTAERRIEAVAALAGGHPRIWMLFAGCVSITALDELVPLFLESLDDLTPYYQSRVGMLPRQQQAIVMTMCKFTGAHSNSQIAHSTNIGERQVATAMSDLERKGFIKRSILPGGSQGDRRIRWWELREPLLRLSLDVKHSRGKPLRIVVEFLREWYGLRLYLEEELLMHDSLGKRYVRAALAGPVPMDWRAVSATIDELTKDERTSLIDCVVRERSADLAKLLAEDDQPISVPLRDALTNTHDPVAVLSILTDALENDPQRVALIELRARLLTQLERFDDAEALITGALANGVRHPRLLTEWASVQRWRNDYERSAEILRDAANEFPRNSWIQHELGYTLERLGALDDSLGAYRRAVELAPRNAELRTHVVDVLSQMGRTEDALSAADEALASSPNRSSLHRQRGIALGRSGRPEDALGALDRAIELDPADHQAHYFRGSALGDLGLLEEALIARERAADIRPSREMYQFGIGTLQERLGRFDDAVGTYQGLVALSPESDHALHHLAVALRRAGRATEALPVVSEMLRVAPTDAGHLHEAASIHRALGNVDEALSFMQRAVEADPARPRHRFELARLEMEAGHKSWSLTLAAAVRSLLELNIDESIDDQIDRRGAEWARQVALLPAELWASAATAVLGAFADTPGATAARAAIVAPIRWMEPKLIIEWAGAWRSAALPHDPHLEMSTSMLDAAAGWLEDHNEAHLLGLAPEQRAIVEDLLGLRAA